MAHVTADRVKETSITTGTGAFTLAGAATGYRAFSAVMATSDTCFYCIALQSGSEWEVGLGTYSGVNTLTRTTVLASSNAGSAVTFSAGTKDVFITLAAAKILQTVDVATAAQYESNTAGKLLDTTGVWNAMAETTLTDGATVNWDMGTGFDFVVTLGGNRTLAAPTNPKVGQKGRFRVAQDATGSRTLAWNANFDFAGGTAPALSTTASAYDVFYYDVRTSTSILVSPAGRAFS